MSEKKELDVEAVWARITKLVHGPKDAHARVAIRQEAGLLEVENRRLMDELCGIDIGLVRKPLNFFVEDVLANMVASVRHPRYHGPGNACPTIKIVKGLGLVVCHRLTYDTRILHKRHYVDGFLVGEPSSACKYADVFAVAVTERAKTEPWASMLRRLSDIQWYIRETHLSLAE